MEDLKIGDKVKERYELIKFLGSGQFGDVWLAIDLMTGREVAIKIFISLDSTGIEMFQKEYISTADINSKYLLSPEYYDVFERHPFLISRYCKQGNASKLTGKLSEEELWDFIYDVAHGLEVLHNQSKPIVHQDIKPDNILIDNNGTFVITDFGISKFLRTTMPKLVMGDELCGSRPYMAPERFDSTSTLSTASDIWSLGVSIYELATGELPFSGFGGAMQRSGASIPSLPSNFSKKLNLLMQRCLCLEPNKRPTAREIWEIKPKRGISESNPSIDKVNNNPSNCKEKITDFVIDNPKEVIRLNISGRTIETKITPNLYFEEFWIICICLSIIFFQNILNLNNIKNFIEINPHNLNLKDSYENIFYIYYILCYAIFTILPSLMFIVGYKLFLNWHKLGINIIRGSEYIFIFYLLVGFIFSINKLLNSYSSFWDTIIEISILCYLIFGILLIIRKIIIVSTYYNKNKLSEIKGEGWIWYNKYIKIFFTILFEIILPLILILLFISPLFDILHQVEELMIIILYKFFI